VAHSRIDDLRRRVEADPASIAFAQLAEEYRRAGQTEEAVRVCREGLTRHPGYLSARVTLGRALLDLGQLDDARTELQFVASEAPENLAAVRGLAEIFHREGDASSALEYFQRALALARHDPELEEIVQQLSRQVGAESAPTSGLTFEEAHQELLSAGDRVPLVPVSASAAEPGTPAGDDTQGSTAPFDFDTLVAALGTPAAPPLVEAVVRGETPQVFELPELPPVAGDPFALLEAELRAQPAEESDADVMLPSQLQDEAPEEGWLTPRVSEAAAETPEPAEPSEPATPALDPWFAAEIDAAADATAEAVDSSDVSQDGTVVDGPSALADDVGEVAAEPPPAAVTELVEPSGASAPVTEDDVADAHPPASDSIEAAPMTDPESTAVTAEQAAEPPAEPSAGPPAPAPPRRGDDVLGELEDWLHTLQDRSDS
jgi:hypothetical protein